MDNNRKSFAFFRSYWQAAKQIDDPLSRLEFYDALCETSFTGKTQTIKNSIANIAYTLILPTILKGIAKYENGSKEKATEKENKDIGIGVGKSETEAKRKQNGSETEAKRKQKITFNGFENQRNYDYDELEKRLVSN